MYHSVFWILSTTSVLFICMFMVWKAVGESLILLKVFIFPVNPVGSLIWLLFFFRLLLRTVLVLEYLVLLFFSRLQKVVILTNLLIRAALICSNTVSLMLHIFFVFIHILIHLEENTDSFCIFSLNGKWCSLSYLLVTGCRVCTCGGSHMKSVSVCFSIQVSR